MRVRKNLVEDIAGPINQLAGLMAAASEAAISLE